MEIYEFGNPDAHIVLIEPIHTVEGMEHEAGIIEELAGPDFFLQAVRVDWFNDLSPWKAPGFPADKAGCFFGGDFAADAVRDAEGIRRR